MTISNGNNLTTGSLWASIWRTSWPMLVIMVLNFVVGFADVYVAGLIGPDVQAAVGFVSQIFFLILILANALSIGTLSIVSRAIGSGDVEQARNVARQSLVFGGMMAAVLTAVGFFFAHEIVSLAGFPEAIRGISVSFLRIYSLALGANYLLIISNAVFRASGEVLKPMATMVVVSAVNVAGNFALVFGFAGLPALGYQGIAVASAVSLVAGTIMNLLFFSGPRWHGMYRHLADLSFDTVKRTLAISWPAALLQISWNAGSIILYNILGRLGDSSITALAAMTNGFRIEGIIFLPAFALNMAASVLIGQNLGAANPERAEKAGWRLGKTGVVLMSAMALPIFIAARPIAALLSSDEAVIAETVRYLRFNMVSEPFMALSVVLGGGLQGAGDTRGTMWVVITAMWLIRLPLAALFALQLDYGATGVWAAMVVSMYIQGILMARRFRQGKWKTATS